MEIDRSESRFSDPGGFTTCGRWMLVGLLAATILGGVLRLAELDRPGLKGSDNTFYTAVAREWSEGETSLSIGDGPTAYYRPVVFAVYASAIRFLGFNDASIKIVNASLDVLNILLVFLLAFVLSRRDLRAASAAAVIYSLLPFTILISRSELSHTLSTTTQVFAMVLFSLSWFTEKRTTELILVFASGIATGLSALTHEELIFTAAAPALFLLLKPLRGSDGLPPLLTAAVRTGSYLVGVLLTTHGMLMMRQGEAQQRAAGIAVHRISESQYWRFIERPLKFGWNSITGSSSTLLASLVVILALVLAARFVIRWKKGRTGGSRPGLPIEDLPLWTTVLHLLLHSCFFVYSAVRLFVPLIPLVIVWLVVRSTALSDRLLGRRATCGVLAILTGAVVTANLGHISTYSESMASHFERWTPLSLAADLGPGAGWSAMQRTRTKPSWGRKRHDELGPAVTGDARLLVAPSTFHPYPGRRLLQIGYYFGDDAVYLLDHEQPIERLITEKQIGFVLFSTFQNDNQITAPGCQIRRYRYEGRWSSSEPFILGASLGLAEGEYTVFEEFERLRDTMTRRGARIILGRRDLLNRRPSGTDSSSYIVWVLDPEDWPLLERVEAAVSRSLELTSRNRITEAIETLDTADTTEMHRFLRFRLHITGARILVENGRPGQACDRVGSAMALLPRSTTMSTALREVFPTEQATREIASLFSRLEATKPRNRPLRDLLLALSLNLSDFSLEAGNANRSIDALQAMERRLETWGSKRFTLAVADWCSATAWDLARQGRTTEARAAAGAALKGRSHFN